MKITTGNVNSLMGVGDDTRYLQISTPIQPGNSGGPVVDKSGNLIGVTAATLKDIATSNAGTVPQNVNFAIRASLLGLFLDSRGVAFQAVDAAGPSIATADLADKIAPATVQILCHGSPPVPVAATAPAALPADVPAPSSLPPNNEPAQKAKDFAYRYNSAWSSDNVSALQFMNSVYSGQVNYFGKELSADEVLKDKRRFADRWPSRQYAIRDGSLSVECAVILCRVNAIIDWQVRSEKRKKVASGAFPRLILARYGSKHNPSRVWQRHPARRLRCEGLTGTMVQGKWSVQRRFG